MALTPKNWTLNTYTVDTWTDVVNEPSTIASMVISNTSVSNATVQLRLQDGGVSQVIILPPAVFLPNEVFTLDLRSLNITGTQTLQLQSDIVGVEALASGVI